MMFIKHGRSIFTNRNMKFLTYVRVIINLFSVNDRSITTEKLNHFHLAFCDGSSLITEQNIQSTCGLDSFCFSNQNIVIQHFACILHQYQGNHKRKSFRYCTDNDHNSEGQCVDHIHENILPALYHVSCRTACQNYKMNHIQKGNHYSTSIANLGDLSCQNREFYLQW